MIQEGNTVQNVKQSDKPKEKEKGSTSGQHRRTQRSRGSDSRAN